MFDGLAYQHKQNESFGLSTRDLKGDFVNRNSFPLDRNIRFNVNRALSLNLNNVQSNTYTTFGASLGALSGKWAGLVAAPNGYLYGIPFSATSILKVDPRTDTYTTFGSLSSDTNKWQTGFLYGKYIFGWPRNAGSILRIDTETDDIDYVMPFAAATNNIISGVLTDSGRAYAIPYSALRTIWFYPDKVSQYDPSLTGGDQLYRFGDFASATQKYCSGVQAHNGKIYCVPQFGTDILVINPKDDSHYTFGTFAGTNKWLGAVLSKEGNIYAMPYGTTSILKIDPSNDTYKTFGSFGTSNGSWAGCVLGPDGFIYGIPQNATTVLKINTSTDTASTFGSLGAGNRYVGGCLAFNGSIYLCPFGSSATQVGKINSEIPGGIDRNFVLNRNFNKN